MGNVIMCIFREWRHLSIAGIVSNVSGLLILLYVILEHQLLSSEDYRRKTQLIDIPVDSNIQLTTNGHSHWRKEALKSCSKHMHYDYFGGYSLILGLWNRPNKNSHVQRTSDYFWGYFLE